MAKDDARRILVVGSGMSGITAALEAAEAGYNVTIVERNPYLGGRVVQFYQYFPKLCPPTCGVEINLRRIRNNPRIQYYTMAEVEKISGGEGAYNVSVKINPRYVNEKCTACGKCAEACSLEIDNPFNYGMNKTKAAYLPHDMAFPLHYVIDPSLAAGAEAQKVKEACPYDAIDLDMSEKRIELNTGSIIWATGWKPYDASKLDSYDIQHLPDVITNVMMERLAAPSGPTEGKILCPSSGQAPQSVAFIHCAGSRDVNHLPFCSGICCLASMKQALYVREKLPETKVTLYFIDLRAPDRLEAFMAKIQNDDKIELIKGKVAQITPNPGDGRPLLKLEDTISGNLKEVTADLVVLATGMQPSTLEEPVPAEVKYDDYGFIDTEASQPGIYAAGCVRTPDNVSAVVQDGTAAALKGIQSIVRRAQ